MGFLFNIFGEMFFMFAVVAFFAVCEHLAFKSSKRLWMWVAGLLGIAALIWFKGVWLMWSWMLGAGWLGVLAWCDHKLHVEAKEAAAGELSASPSKRVMKSSKDKPSGSTRSVGRHGQ